MLFRQFVSTYIYHRHSVIYNDSEFFIIKSPMVFEHSLSWFCCFAISFLHDYLHHTAVVKWKKNIISCYVYKMSEGSFWVLKNLHIFLEVSNYEPCLVGRLRWHNLVCMKQKSWMDSYKLQNINCSVRVIFSNILHYLFQTF